MNLALPLVFWDEHDTNASNGPFRVIMNEDVLDAEAVLAQEIWESDQSARGSSAPSPRASPGSRALSSSTRSLGRCPGSSPSPSPCGRACRPIAAGSTSRARRSRCRRSGQPASWAHLESRGYAEAISLIRSGSYRSRKDYSVDQIVTEMKVFAARDDALGPGEP